MPDYCGLYARLSRAVKDEFLGRLDIERREGG